LGTFGYASLFGTFRYATKFPSYSLDADKGIYSEFYHILHNLGLRAFDM